MISAIDSLGADVCWLTSWAANANAVVGPFIGWPPLPTLTKQTTAGWWKVEAVEAHLASAAERRIAWVDDDLDRYADLVDDRLAPWMRADRALTLAPTPGFGLSRGELDAISDFFDSGSAVEAFEVRVDDDGSPSPI